MNYFTLCIFSHPPFVAEAPSNLKKSLHRSTLSLHCAVLYGGRYSWCDVVAFEQWTHFPRVDALSAHCITGLSPWHLGTYHLPRKEVFWNVCVQLASMGMLHECVCQSNRHKNQGIMDGLFLNPVLTWTVCLFTTCHSETACSQKCQHGGTGGEGCTET